MGSIDDIAKVVDDSADVNVSQLVGTQEGETLVPAYKWDTFFAPYFTKLIGIKKYHHFRFSADSPGTVFVKKFSDSKEVPFDLLTHDSWVPNSGEMPEVINRPGLSVERQQYLYEKIREFCPQDEQDRVCPKPATVPSQASPECSSEDEPEPQSKRQRLCGICRQPGHTRRTCPEK